MRICHYTGVRGCVIPSSSVRSFSSPSKGCGVSDIWTSYIHACENRIRFLCKEFAIAMRSDIDILQVILLKLYVVYMSNIIILWSYVYMALRWPSESVPSWAFQTRVCRHHGRCHLDGKAINILDLEDTYTPHCKPRQYMLRIGRSRLSLTGGFLLPLLICKPVSYTHLTLPTIYSV